MSTHTSANFFQIVLVILKQSYNWKAKAKKKYKVTKMHTMWAPFSTVHNTAHTAHLCNLPL